jgi:dihydrofolate reductase
MRKLIYLMNVSLDGFVEGPDGKFGFAFPDEEVHRFHNETARQLDAELYGRRLYETMAVWQTYGTDSSVPDYVAEYGRIWRAMQKIVFSSTLKTVGENCRLVSGDAAAEVRSLKEQPGRDLAVGGPGLASTLAQAGLIDEYRLVVYPVIVGGGKSYFPKLRREVGLRLEETRTFRGGVLYLRYLVR